MFCDKHGIQRHLTAPYSPQQNGVVERRNRTLMEMTRSIMKHTKVPNYLWGEAVRHSTYLINRIGTRTLQLQTPYECFKKKRPNVGHLRVFGCVCYAKNNTPHLRKLDNRSRELVHLGTEPGTKAYRLLDPKTRKVVVSRDVVFMEERTWNWNAMEGDSRDDHEEVIFPDRCLEKEATRNLEQEVTNKEEDDALEEEEEEADSETEDLDTEPQQLRRSTRESKRPAYLDDYVLMTEILETERMLINEEPGDWNEARHEKVWREACEVEITSIKKNKTWTLVDLPLGCKAIGLK